MSRTRWQTLAGRPAMDYDNGMKPPPSARKMHNMDGSTCPVSPRVISEPSVISLTEATPDVAERTWDVIVIGAGPAGALTALCAAREGMETLLVERKRFPRAKVCGGCLNAAGVGLLASLGVGAIATESGLPVDHLQLGLRGKRARLPLPGGVAIPRTRLDSELVVQAQAAGAVFLSETRATLRTDDGATREVILSGGGGDRKVRGRAVVVAAGLGSSALGQDTPFATRVARGARLGTGCVVERFDPSDYPAGRISMAIGRGGYVGLTPTVEGLAVASAVDPAFLKSAGSPADAAAIILEEVGFAPVSAMRSAEWSGTLPLTRTTRPVAASRVFLVGDAAGYVEPFTGQGMAIALQGAFALTPYLARTVGGERPDAVAAAWTRNHARSIRTRHWPAALVAAITRRRGVAGFAFALAGAVPAIPGALVRAVNRPVVGSVSP